MHQSQEACIPKNGLVLFLSAPFSILHRNRPSTIKRVLSVDFNLHYSNLINIHLILLDEILKTTTTKSGTTKKVLE